MQSAKCISSVSCPPSLSSFFLHRVFLKVPSECIYLAVAVAPAAHFTIPNLFRVEKCTEMPRTKSKSFGRRFVRWFAWMHHNGMYIVRCIANSHLSSLRLPFYLSHTIRTKSLIICGTKLRGLRSAYYFRAGMRAICATEFALARAFYCRPGVCKLQIFCRPRPLQY